MRSSLRALLLLTLCVPLLPLAQADHAYSHRYIIFGRVVDSTGLPVPGLSVQLAFEDLDTEGSCGNQPGTETEAFGPTRTQPVTNEYGEFMFCTHAHRMSRALPGRAILTLPALGVREEAEVDVYWRHAYVPIQLDAPHPNARPPSNMTHTVVGTLWRRGETTVEGIPVFGETVDQANVTVRVEVPGRDPILLASRTNNYGDFALRVPLDANVTTGRVVVEALNKTFTQTLDTRLGATYVQGEFEQEANPTLRRALLVLALLGVSALLVGAGIYAYRTHARRAELREVRARSTRKRANK